MWRWVALRRVIALILCILLLPIPAARGQEIKYVALTFDDGPSGRFTRRLLDGLAQRKVNATFLLCGYRMAQDRKLAVRILEEGHEIGLHGYSHTLMHTMSQGEIRRELEQTLALMPPGCAPIFFRPPGGVTTPAVKAAAKEMDLAILNWSVDPRDWAKTNADDVQSAIMDLTGDGDVILLHDMRDSSVDAALATVDRLLEQGYRFVTASQLAAIRGILPVPGEVYCSFAHKSANTK